MVFLAGEQTAHGHKHGVYKKPFNCQAIYMGVLFGVSCKNITRETAGKGRVSSLVSHISIG